MSAQSHNTVSLDEAMQAVSTAPKPRWTPDEFAAKLKEIDDIPSLTEEEASNESDKLVCQLLTSLGYKQAMIIYATGKARIFP